MRLYGLRRINLLNEEHQDTENTKSIFGYSKDEEILNVKITNFNNLL